MPELRKMIDADKAEGYVFMFILYLIVSFGIFGTSLMMLAERRYEFGVMISLGMKKSMLALTVWFEMIALSLLGALSGMIAAFPICLYYNINPIKLGGDMTEMLEEYGMEAVLQFSIDSGIFTTQAIIVFLLASIISIYAFVKILNFNPIKEMIAFAHQHNVLVLVDGAQAAPHTKIDVQDLDCDFYKFQLNKNFTYSNLNTDLFLDKNEFHFRYWAHLNHHGVTYQIFFHRSQIRVNANSTSP